VDNYLSISQVKSQFKLSQAKLQLLMDGNIVIKMGLRFVAMELEFYTYYGKTKVRQIYYTKPKYTLDNMPKSFKKTITYGNSYAPSAVLSLSSKSDYHSQQYTTLSTDNLYLSKLSTTS